MVFLQRLDAEFAQKSSRLKSLEPLKGMDHRAYVGVYRAPNPESKTCSPHVQPSFLRIRIKNGLQGLVSRGDC